MNSFLTFNLFQYLLLSLLLYKKYNTESISLEQSSFSLSNHLSNSLDVPEAPINYSSVGLSFRDGEIFETRGRRQFESRITFAPKCTTPKKTKGRCLDIQDCPFLLTDLNNLRLSICFKSLIVPGVCCPDESLVDDVFDNEKTSTSTTTTTPSPSLPSSGDFISNSETENPLLSDSECGVSKVVESRIVGGNNTFLGEYPWMAAIYLHGGGRTEFWCGGTLISSRHVVTAAHCTKDTKKRSFLPTQYTVHLGEWDLHDLSPESKVYSVLSVTAHPEFRANGFYSDVAIFTLNEPVEFTKYIVPICLPYSKSLNYEGSTPIVLGWGTTSYGGIEAGQLKAVALPVWSNEECDRSYFQPITKVFLCAGYRNGGRDACQGDSGGPLMLYDSEIHRWTLIGIVSFGNRCAEPGYPGVYTRITHFKDWILANMT